MWSCHRLLIKAGSDWKLWCTPIKAQMLAQNISLSSNKTQTRQSLWNLPLIRTNTVDNVPRQQVEQKVLFHVDHHRLLVAVTLVLTTTPFPTTTDVIPPLSHVTQWIMWRLWSRPFPQRQRGCSCSNGIFNKSAKLDWVVSNIQSRLWVILGYWNNSWGLWVWPTSH